MSLCYENTDSEIERKQAVSVTQFTSNGSFKNKFLLWITILCSLYKGKKCFPYARHEGIWESGITALLVLNLST